MAEALTQWVFKGRGDQSLSHTNNGGGWVLNSVYGSPTWYNYQDANGGPTSGDLVWGGTGEACNITEGADGNCRITRPGGGSAADFKNCVAGTIANVIIPPGGDHEGDSGLYEVTAVAGDGTYIDVALSYIGADTCDVKVGGAKAGLDVVCSLAAARERVLVPGETTYAIGTEIAGNYSALSSYNRVEIRGCNKTSGAFYTRADRANYPVLQASAAITSIMQTGSSTTTGYSLHCIIFDGNAQATYCIRNVDLGSMYWNIHDCIFTGATSYGMYNDYAIAHNFFDCEVYGNGAGVFQDYEKQLYYNCSIHDNTGTGFRCDNNGPVVLTHCVIYGNGGVGIDLGGNLWQIINCDIFRNGSHGVVLANYGNASASMFVGNNIWDNVGYGVNFTTDPVLGTTSYRMFGQFSNNNSHGNAGHCNIADSDELWDAFYWPYPGDSSFVNTHANPVVANEGDGTEDLTRQSGCGTIGVGWPQEIMTGGTWRTNYPTAGAFNRQADVGGGGGTYPTESQVLLDVVFGATEELTGNVTLPSINDVQNGVAFGASLGLTGVFVSPAVGDVQSGVEYGASAEFTGTFAVPLENIVKDGETYGAAAEFEGTYPTTETSQAAQLATDKAAVETDKANIKDDTTILTITGTYDYAGAISDAEAAAAAAQLVTDKAAVTAGKAGMTTETTILTVTGTLDLATYVLISNVVDKKYVLIEHDNYVGGDGGTLTLSDPDYVFHSQAEYGVVGELLDPAFFASDIANCAAGNVKLDVTIDDITGTYAGDDAPPAAPGITAVRLSATSIRVTIEGDAGVTNEVRYKLSSAAVWADGGDRAGDGVVDIADLTTGNSYIITCFSQSGDLVSEPAAAVVVTVTADVDDGTPAGGLSLPLSYLKETLAGSTVFRTWVGATTGTEEENIAAAKLRIYTGEAEADNWVRPYALIDHNTNWNAEKRAEPNAFDYHGGLLLAFEADLSGGDDALETMLYKFTNQCGQIVDQMKLLSGVYPYLTITDINLEDGPVRCSKEERTAVNVKEDYWQIYYGVAWQ